MKDDIKIKRVLISVSDKSNLIKLGMCLINFNCNIITSDGTAKYLKKNNIKCQTIEEYYNLPQILEGRIKSISRNLYAEILFDRSSLVQQEEIKKLKLSPIDMVICNFYDLSIETIKKDFDSLSNDNLKKLINTIDIGGPTMVKAAIKNYQNVVICTNPNNYINIINELNNTDGFISYTSRLEMMKSALKSIIKNDTQLAQNILGENLKYGENPHQSSFIVPSAKNFKLYSNNKQLTYNNYLDLDAAFYGLEQLKGLDIYLNVAIVIKHNNPCGIAIGKNMDKALKLAFDCDQLSSFGGIVALNNSPNEEIVNLLNDKFIEILFVPKLSITIKNKLLKRHKNLRIVVYGNSSKLDSEIVEKQTHFGSLWQNKDNEISEKYKQITKKTIPKDYYNLAKFGEACVKLFWSNSIIIVRQIDNYYQLVASGYGQPNRLHALTMLAIPKFLMNFPKCNRNTCLIVSDGFFPFPDFVKTLDNFGFKYVIQPGGSIRDKLIINECDKYKIAMAFSEFRHFKH